MEGNTHVQEYIACLIVDQELWNYEKCLFLCDFQGQWVPAYNEFGYNDISVYK